MLYVLHVWSHVIYSIYSYIPFLLFNAFIGLNFLSICFACKTPQGIL